MPEKVTMTPVEEARIDVTLAIQDLIEALNSVYDFKPYQLQEITVKTRKLVSANKKLNKLLDSP
jgi:hypothetical protein